MLVQLSNGQTDPSLLASLAKGRLREKRAELEASLVGRIEPHHRLLIVELLAHVDYLDESIERLSAEMNTGSVLLTRISGWSTRFPE